jgi:hypothetical protein
MKRREPVRTDLVERDLPAWYSHIAATRQHLCQGSA